MINTYNITIETDSEEELKFRVLGRMPSDEHVYGEWDSDIIGAIENFGIKLKELEDEE